MEPETSETRTELPLDPTVILKRPTSFKNNVGIHSLAEVQRILRIEADAVLMFAEQLRKEISEEEETSPLSFSARLDSQHPILRTLSWFQKCTENGGKVVCIGVGKSGKIAAKISATLSSTGSPSLYLHPSDALHGDLGTIGPKDVIFILSHSGNTEEILRLMVPLKNLGLPVIGLGGNKHSRLALQCDVWIHAAIQREACPHNLAPTCSTTLALVIGDALALTLMQIRGLDTQAFAKNHPGGALGSRLKLKVSQIMHHGETVGTVDVDSTIKEIVEKLSETRLGAVLVVDDKKLLGIITDGDLRRALSQSEGFFSLKAKNIMCHQPVTIGPDELAHTALELLENRPFPIKELPVVDQDHNWLGLIRIHDLLQSIASN